LWSLSFFVDWSGGSFDPYDQAVVNTQVVGAVISELVKALHNTTPLDYSNVHLIGHSLGSHICGFAGERIPGLGRITGKLQVKKSLKISKGQSETVYRRTDNTMAKRKSTKGQTTIDKTYI
jgi:hypothetical protein